MKTSKLFVAAAAIAASVSCALIAQPAYAGYWALSGTPTGGFTFTGPAQDHSNPTLNPTYSANSMSFDIAGGGGRTPASMTGSVNYTGTITWVGGGTAPSYATINETSYAMGRSQVQGPYMRVDAWDGLGDNPSYDSSYFSNYYGYYHSGTMTSTGSRTYYPMISQGGSYTITRQITSYGECDWYGSYGGELRYSVSVN